MTPPAPPPVDFDRLLELFPDMLALPAAQRPAFLDRHCSTEPALRHELEAMLAASERASVLDQAPQVRSTAGTDIAATGPMAAGTRVGVWRIVQMIGRGGMGEVYLAERADGGFAQQAAIKLLHGDAAQHAERFEEERRILAQLTHPNIARLLDGGLHDGQAWMAMEYVPGLPIATHCRVHALPLQARLKLFHQTCAAVAHAHAALVVHRDLKPTNILVDAHGTVKLLDFGIAKLIGPQATLRATHTAAFTPDHAAPEQIEGGPITTATDVYALGVVLYELVGGRLPWSFGDTPLSRAIDRLLREDPPPSSRAAAETGDPALPAHAIDADLDAIVGRCLRRLPEDRYASVQALRDDLDRLVQRQPVLARSGGRRYRLRLWLRRNRLFAGVGAVAVVALLSGLAVALWQAGQARQAAQRALAQQRLAQQQRAQVQVQANSSVAVQTLLMRMFTHAVMQDGGNSTTVRDLLDGLQSMAAHDDSLDADARAQLSLRLAKLGIISGDVDAANALLARARPLIAKAGGARPRLLALQLDVQLLGAMTNQDNVELVQLAPPLVRLLETQPQPLDAELDQAYMNALRLWGWALEQQGLGDQSLAIARRALRAVQARDGVDSARARTAQVDLARAYLKLGHYRQAAAELHVVVRADLATGKTGMDQTGSLMNLVEALRQLPDGLPEAGRMLDVAAARAATDPAMPAFYRHWISAVRADLLRDQGQLDAAASMLATTAGFRPDRVMREQRGVRALVLATAADLTWAQGNANASADAAREGLAFIGSPLPGVASEQQRFHGLRLRLLRAQAAIVPPVELRTQVAAAVHDLDAMPIVQRAPYLLIAVEALQGAGLHADAQAMAQRAMAAADAVPEPNPRVQAQARALLRATTREAVR